METFQPSKKDIAKFLSIPAFFIFVPAFFVILEIYKSGQLFDEGPLIFYGLLAFLMLFYYFGIKSLKISLSDDTLFYKTELFIHKSVPIAEILRAKFSYGSKMERHLTLENNEKILADIVVSIWGEDDLIKLLKALSKKNPNIDTDDQYDKVILATEKSEYDFEKKIIRNRNLLQILWLTVPSILIALIWYASILLSS